MIGRSRGSLQSPSNCFQMWAASPGSNHPASNTEPFDCTQTWPVRLPNRPAPPQARRPGFSEFVCKSELTSEYASVFHTRVQVSSHAEHDWRTVIQELYIIAFVSNRLSAGGAGNARKLQHCDLQPGINPPSLRSQPHLDYTPKTHSQKQL